MAKPSKPPKHWPTPNEPATTLDVFRVEIGRPFTSDARVVAYVHELVKAGNRTARDHRMDLMLAATPADPTVGANLQEALDYLESAVYALYLRRKAELEGA